MTLQVVCAASAVLDKFGGAANIVREDGFSINENLHFIIEGETLFTNAKSAGLGIIEFAGAFDRLKPDVIVLMADRYEVLSAAIAASYQNIPLAHVQGGEVSGNIDEKVRHAITKLADIHFPATKRARDWLIRMGENHDSIFQTGCPSIDLAKEVLDNPDLNFNFYDKYHGVGERFDLSNEYYIVMQHAVTTAPKSSAKHVNETLHAVLDLKKPVIWFWPNADAGSDDTSKAIRIFRENYDIPHIYFIKNMEPQDFLRLLNLSSGIIGNSSAAIREASYLGVPAINLGSRQINRERGPNVIDVEHEREAIKTAIKSHFVGKKEQSFVYGNAQAGKKIAEVLATSTLNFSKNLNYIEDEKYLQSGD